MRRVSAIALLFLYLSVNTDLLEIMRFPVLFEHFYEHKQVNREFSFVGFIVLHYFRSDVKDADYERDQQLPFKGTHCEMTSLSVAITAENTPVAPRPTGEVIQKLVMYSSPFTSSLTQFAVWQPPKA
jgi:hypothetical protein